MAQITTPAPRCSAGSTRTASARVRSTYAAHVKNSHITSVHVLRGVAALLVVWAHLSAYWLFTIGETSTIQDAWTNAIAGPLHVYQNGGFVGVLIFFLISGYIVTHASMSESRLSYLTKRVFRIFPPLLFALAVLWVLMHAMVALGFQLRTFEGGPPVRWLLSVLLVDGFIPGPMILSVTWTLSVEILFYALILAVITKQRDHPLGTTAAIAATWAIASFASLYIPAFDQTPEARFDAHGVLFIVGVLLVGRCIYLAHTRLSSRPAATALALGIAVSVGTLQEMNAPGFLLAPGGFTDTEPILGYATALIVFIAMLWWSPAHAVRPLRWLGDTSYSLYLLHMPVGFATLGVLYRYDVPNSLATLIAIAASLLAARVGYVLVERPSQRLARTLLKRSSISPNPPLAHVGVGDLV